MALGNYICCLLFNVNSVLFYYFLTICIVFVHVDCLYVIKEEWVCSCKME